MEKVIRRKCLALVLEFIFILVPWVVWVVSLGGFGEIDDLHDLKSLVFVVFPIFITVVWVIPVSILSDWVTRELSGVFRFLMTLLIHLGLGYGGVKLFADHYGIFGFIAAVLYWISDETVRGIRWMKERKGGGA